jgi:valyl-tRNA synthetase
MSEPSSPLAKTFDPSAIETKWYRHWEETGAFRPHRPEAEPFTIVNPPPNVTGSLHIGHALDNTLQDILIRHARLQGKDALWVVGTDHAGIATQMVVERQLEAQQDKRTNYSREDFIDKVWEWKRESGGEITRQLRRLGCSMDWSREQFTMDPHFSKAVIKVFVDLYNEGLIYRDKRLVNWDPKLKTAISDLEVETVEVKGSFWHFKYPLADGVTLENGVDHIVVATTRPETMLADMAVAVNADDPRYKSVIGKEILQPITGRRFRIVADEHADPELGSGAVKITPGHDFNDFEVGKRAGFKPADMLNMFDAEANVVQTTDGLIPPEFLGLHRFRRDGADGARELVVAQMKALGHLVPHTDKDGVAHDAEPRTIATPFGDRGGVVIEPWLTDQWYVDAKTLAQPAIDAVRSGAIKVVPQSWEKTYFNWMENIQPWCVSRQLWWGHRIPAWYGPKKAPADASLTDITWTTEDQPFVASDESALSEQLAEYYGADKEFIFFETEGEYLDWDSAVSDNLQLQAENVNMVPIFRDEDVLDTWFSSALWPFGTLGWPGEPASPLAGEAARLGEPLLAKLVAAGEGDATSEGSAPAPSSSEGEGLLDRHYPNDVLVSGFDILFFWDARMAMQGLHFMKEVPWRTLYLHGLVRAADGSKMSKSKGNTVDPLILMDKYGTDALRFFMAAMESQGRDIKMDESRVEGYRNFATKLWNAARFCQSNGIGASQSVAAPKADLAVNRWIIGEVVETLAKLNKAFDEFRFDGMADTIYHFAWGTFCDWYLELIKPDFVGGVKQLLDLETKSVAAWVFDQILVMLHPFMPFITEELWAAMGDRGGRLIIHATWPEPVAAVDPVAKTEINRLIEILEDLRSERVGMNVPPKSRIFAGIIGANKFDRRILNEHVRQIRRMTNIIPSALNVKPMSDGGTFIGGEPSNSFVDFSGDTSDQIISLRLRSKELELFGNLEQGFADDSAERARLTSAVAAVSKERDSLAGRLANPAFVEKAKPEAVEKARADHAEKAAEVDRLTAALSRLG